MIAYLVLITWPDGREGLLFPRPGNVAIADTPEKGKIDFDTAKQHLLAYAESTGGVLPSLRNQFRTMKSTTIRLIKFERVETLQEFTL